MTDKIGGIPDDETEAELRKLFNAKDEHILRLREQLRKAVRTNIELRARLNTATAMLRRFHAAVEDLTDGIEHIDIWEQHGDQLGEPQGQ